jgi:hypothetical protein
MPLQFGGAWDDNIGLDNVDESLVTIPAMFQGQNN